MLHPKKILGTITTFLILSSLMSGFQAATSQNNSNVVPSSDLPVLDPLFSEQNYQFEIEIWVMMTQDFDRDALLNSLPQWYAPVERYPSFYTTGFVYDLNYTISYSFRNFTTTEILEFRGFLYNNSVKDLPPLYAGTLTSSARYVSSDPVEDYLVSLGMDRPTMVFIDTYTPDPANFDYYYYNASSVELDGYSNARPYGATYQVSGGGHHAPLLWYDFSAGPSSYRGDDFPHITQMNDTQLLEAMIHHLQRAIELRFLPSWLYSPLYAYKTVTFDYVLIDLTNGSYDFLAKLDTAYIENQYSQLNPMATWSSRIRTYDYSSDQDFLNILSQSRNDTDHSYYSWDIVNYLQGLKSTLFNQSTKEDITIPIFLFGFPDDWLFDSFLGIAMNEGQNFSFVISAANERWSDPTPDFEDVTTVAFNLNAGLYYAISNPQGYTNEIVETIVTSDLPVNVYALDPFEYEKYVNGSAFKPIVSFTSVTSISFNFSAHIYQNYYWVVENPNFNPTNIVLDINIYEDRSFGLTFVTMHEAGHAFGLSHPHDGFSWIEYQNTGYGEIFDWLWDLSYTQMTYAHHYKEISIMDLSTYYRGVIPKIMKDIEKRYNSAIEEIKANSAFIPKDLVDIAANVPGMLENMTMAFTKWMEKNIPGYLQAIPYGKPGDFFPAFEFTLQKLIEIETYDLDLRIPIFVIDANAEDYYVKFEDSITGKVYYEGNLADITVLNLTYARVTVTVTRLSDNQSVLFSFDSWNLIELRFNPADLFRNDPDPTESTPTETTPTEPTSNSSISTTVPTEPKTSENPQFTLPFSITLILAIPIIAITRKKVS